MTTPQITVLQLDPGCPPARFGTWLEELGADLRVVATSTGPLPDADELGDGLVILGGRMAVDAQAEHAWLAPLADLIVAAHELDLPILGICLGHQALAAALGGRVVVADPGGGEKGPTEITWLPEALDDPLLGDLAAAGPATVAMSHYDVVAELPPGAVELARSTAYPHQAFRHGTAYGVQFHPEATPELIGYWSARHGLDDEALREATRAADTAIVASGRAVAEGFARLVSERQRRPAPA